MRLLLIRHGQTPANVRGELDTAHPGPGLTPLGHRQAAAIPAALAAEGIDAVFVSTLVRTQLTVAPLAAALALEPQVLPGVHEIEAGSMEMATDHSSYKAYLETAFAWGVGNRDAVMPGSTDGHAFFTRFDASVEQIARSGAATAVLVSHGAAIRVWAAGTATDIPPMLAAEAELGNTGMVELEGSPEDGWKFVSWQGDPIGGARLSDGTAEDPTGEPIDEAVE